MIHHRRLSTAVGGIAQLQFRDVFIGFFNQYFKLSTRERMLFFCTRVSLVFHSPAASLNYQQGIEMNLTEPVTACIVSVR